MSSPKPTVKPKFIFTMQKSCDAIPVSSFSVSNNAGNQAFTVTGYTLSDYIDQGDELSFVYDGNTYSFTILDITGTQITLSLPYNASITNVNTALNFSLKTAANTFNFNKGKFNWEKDKINPFYRLKYSGSVMFKGVDYNYIKAALDEDCCSVLLKVYKLCSGSYNLHYRSYIKGNEGTWDESRCTFETEMPPVDKYTCLTEKGDIEKDLYESEGQLVVVLDDDLAGGFAQGPFFEYHVRANAPIAPGSTYVFGPGDVWSQVNGTGGEASDSNTGNPWTLYVREVRVVIYETADLINFVTPALTGYIFTSEQRVDNKVIARYTNAVLPADAPEYDDKIYGTGGACENGAYIFTAFAIYDPINDNCLYVSPDFPAATITTTYNGRLLQQCLTTLLSSCSGINQRAVSDFFEINPPGDTLGYVAGDNYVTGFVNYVDNIRVSAVSDILDPSIGAENLNITFNVFMAQLNAMFNVFWFIDAQYRLRIEHYSWFLNNPIANVSAEPYNRALKKYTYLKEDTPSREVFKFQQASNVDFVGTDIVYPQACSANVIKKIDASYVTTDINYLRNTTSTKVSNFGMFFWCCKVSTNQVLYEIGRITGTPFLNGHLAWANLHDHYHRHGRALENGMMNFQDETFDSWKKRKKQTGQSLHDCCVEIPETVGTVTTELGVGDAVKISYDINTGVYDFELEV